MPRTRARAYDHMLLITYSVRPGSVERGYEAWLREVDNPFFNAARGFAHYGNWKVVGGANVFTPHVYFDFVGMNDRDSFDAVWNGAEVNEFRREWRRLWNVETPGPAAAIQTCRCERVATSDDAFSPELAFVPGAADAGGGWETWRVHETLRGARLGFDAFSVRYGTGQPAVQAVGGRDRDVLLARCVAAPELGRG